MVYFIRKQFFVTSALTSDFICTRPFDFSVTLPFFRVDAPLKNSTLGELHTHIYLYKNFLLHCNLNSSVYQHFILDVKHSEGAGPLNLTS